MKRLFLLLLIGWTIAAALAGCRTAKPTPERDVSRAEGTPLGQPDSPAGNSEQKTPEPPLVQKTGFLGLFGKKNTLSNPETKIIAGAQPGPRKCKGCTIINAAPGATVTTTTVAKKATAATAEGAVASVTGKKSGPAVVASDSASLNALEGGGNLAAVNGDGNSTDQKKQDTTKEAPGPLATIADNLTGPLGYVLAAAAVGGILFLIIRRRARKAAENLV